MRKTLTLAVCLILGCLAAAHTTRADIKPTDEQVREHLAQAQTYWRYATGTDKAGATFHIRDMYQELAAAGKTLVDLKLTKEQVDAAEAEGHFVQAQRYWEYATGTDKAGATFHIRDMYKELEAAKKTLADLKVTKEQVDAAEAEGHFVQAQMDWQYATSTDKAGATFHIRDMYKELAAAGKTLADLKLTKEQVDAAEAAANK